jgi:phosphatidylinositol glycan class B
MPGSLHVNRLLTGKCQGKNRRGQRLLTFISFPLHFPTRYSQDIKTYKDESDYFYDDPYEFLLHRFSYQAWPSHVSLFTALLEVQGKENKTVGSLLESQGYSIQSEYWNSLFHLDHRRRGNVLLMKRSL